MDKLYIPVIRNRQQVCVFFIDQRYDLLEQWEDDGGDWWDVQ